MSMRVVQPIGQKRLTNIAVVRYKKLGKRFEIACYKNKVLNWRNGIEKDLDEVLQTTRVFSNVSKGILAKQEDLQAAFGTMDEVSICTKILAEGELQVSDKERKVEHDALFLDVANILSEKCVNPQTNRPYTISMIERALRDVHFSVDLNRTAKQQALEALKRLEAKFPITRARMRLKVTIPSTSLQEVMALLTSSGGILEGSDIAAGGQQVVVNCQIEPGLFRSLHALASGSVLAGDVGGGRVEVVALAVAEGDAQLDFMPQEASSTAGPGYNGQQHAHHMMTHSADRERSVGEATTVSGGDAQAAQQQRTVVRSGDVPQAERDSGSVVWQVLYGPGAIGQIPDEHESRRQRFSEIDELQKGWTVELRSKGSTGVVDAVFYSPAGECVGSFANARRAALKVYKEHNSNPNAAQLPSDLRSLKL